MPVSKGFDLGAVDADQPRDDLVSQIFDKMVDQGLPHEPAAEMAEMIADDVLRRVAFGKHLHRIETAADSAERLVGELRRTGDGALRLARFQRLASTLCAVTAVFCLAVSVYVLLR